MFLLCSALLLLVSAQIHAASIHKSRRIAVDERIHGDTIIYRPKVFHNQRTYHVQQNYFPPSQHSYPSYPYPAYQPIYGSYPSGGGLFGFQFCLACFGFSIGK